MEKEIDQAKEENIGRVNLLKGLTTMARETHNSDREN